MQNITRPQSPGEVPAGVSAIESSRQRSGKRSSFFEPILLLRAYMNLVHFDRYLARGDFATLHDEVRTYPLVQRPPGPDSIDRICYAVDTACIWYWKEVLCLQRSATTACLLKGVGVSAQMILGVQQMPFKAHAWVEVDGRVVNDRPYMRDMYTVLDVC
jgi:hypothetical protein